MAFKMDTGDGAPRRPLAFYGAHQTVRASHARRAGNSDRAPVRFKSGNGCHRTPSLLGLDHFQTSTTGSSSSISTLRNEASTSDVKIAKNLVRKSRSG